MIGFTINLALIKLKKIILLAGLDESPLETQSRVFSPNLDDSTILYNHKVYQQFCRRNVPVHCPGDLSRRWAVPVR